MKYPITVIEAEMKVQKVLHSCTTKEQRYLVIEWARLLYKNGLIRVTCIYMNNLFYTPQEKAEF